MNVDAVRDLLIFFFFSLKMYFMFFVSLFFVRYGFNAAYNVYNAFVKKDFQYPWATSCMQLAIGLLYAFPLWGLKLRAIPKISLEDFKLLLPIAALNAAGHSCAVVAMFEKGGGSFTHVIKASEPVVSVILNMLVNKVRHLSDVTLSLLCYFVSIFIPTLLLSFPAFFPNHGSPSCSFPPCTIDCSQAIHGCQFASHHLRCGLRIHSR